MSGDAKHYLQVEFSVQGWWSLDELCALCQLERESLLSLVEEGVLAPQGEGPSNWRFAAEQVRPARTAARLLRDLGVNPPGAALALQLLDELETLRRELAQARAGDELGED